MEINRSVEENNQSEYLVEDATIQPMDEENINECAPLQSTVIEIENPTTTVEATVVDVNNASEYLTNAKVQTTKQKRRNTGILQKCMTPKLFSCCFATAIGTLFLFSWVSLIGPNNKNN
ncbi:hypothetical protein NEAUS03_0963 [Nematocida ausubeli]|nr:hypothetical protein NEAUS03_0963 [Nematocida ausubeli]